MKLGIMQPYFIPYIGYFQLIAVVDRFIVYDNIKYTKKGWINRNRILQNDQDAMISLPLKKGSDSLDVRERELAADFDGAKLLKQIEGAYRKAPHFDEVLPLLREILCCREDNLFGYIHHSIVALCRHLGIETQILISSDVEIDHGLRGQDKVLALCEAMGADVYINAIGGLELYSKDVFAEQGVELKFIRSTPFEYRQFGGAFVPWLSIVDVLMFNPLEAVRTFVTTNHELI